MPFGRCLALTALLLATSTPALAGPVHVVEDGQTLWAISKMRGCSVRAIADANDIEPDDFIRPGQKLTIPSCSGDDVDIDEPAPRGRRTAAREPRDAGGAVLHTIGAGDTLSGLAKKYDTSVDAIKRRNNLSTDMLRDGHDLIIVPGVSGSGRPVLGQSRGLPYSGRLFRGMQLPDSRAYHRRRPYRAWGTSHLIAHVKRVAEAVRRRYPKVHKVAIGDISSKEGGYLPPHHSHQSGRDIDIGFYFKKKPDGYPTAFIVGTGKNLDLSANWLMLERFCSTMGERGGVEKIFLNHELQKLFYDHAKKRKVSQRTLDRMFQYPRGRGADHGCIRHEPGHDDHIHVRFKCPPGDGKCSGNDR